MKSYLPSSIILFGLLALLAALPAGANTQIIGYEKIQQTDILEGDNVEVIITLRPVVVNEGEEEDLSFLSSIDQQRQVIARLSQGSGTVGLQLQSLPIFSASLTQQGVKELAAMNEVYSIEKNWPVVTYTAQGIPLMSSTVARNNGGGGGVAVAIVDTGVNYNHPALGGPGFPNQKVIGGYDFGDNDQDPMEGDSLGADGLEPSSHGTGCAGIAAGIYKKGQNDYIGGVAPEAKVYALKVWQADGNASMMAVLKAWDWCLTHQNDDPDHPIMIISNSIGIPAIQESNSCDPKMPALSQVANKLTAKGITLFIASGNDSMTETISAPSCLEQVISVGAVYDESKGERVVDKVTGYSNSSKILDILAPSEFTTTPSSPGKIYTDRFNGTSAAAPYAAGAAALIQSQHKKTQGRFLSVSELKKIMTENGDVVLDDKSGIKKPRVNVAKSIATFNSEQKKTTQRVAEKAPAQAPPQKRKPAQKSYSGSLFIDEDDDEATKGSGSTTIIGY